MKNNKFTTAQLTLLGLMAAILLLMAYTPLGYLNIGPLAISFNVIPVAISAVVLGPVGGAVAGAILPLSSASSHVFWTVSASDIFLKACERSAIPMWHVQ